VPDKGVGVRVPPSALSSYRVRRADQPGSSVLLATDSWRLAAEIVGACAPRRGAPLARSSPPFRINLQESRPGSPARLFDSGQQLPANNNIHVRRALARLSQFPCRHQARSSLPAIALAKAGRTAVDASPAFSPLLTADCWRFKAATAALSRIFPKNPVSHVGKAQNLLYNEYWWQSRSADGAIREAGYHGRGKRFAPLCDCRIRISNGGPR
jgi:hypothetical protein